MNVVKSIREVLEMYGKIDKWSIGDTVWFALLSNKPSNSLFSINIVSPKLSINKMYNKLSNNLYAAVEDIERG